MVAIEFEKQLRGYGLTTAEILYRMPDHLHLLQSYLWQEYDTAPDFPVLRGFLTFWERELEGPLHTVKVAHRKLISPAEFRPVEGMFRLH
ncbi:MAG: usg protein [Flavobacteriaceae bacterium]